MHIQIIRIRKTAETIDGQLFIDGMNLCDTAENALTAIPAGKYTIDIIKCKQHSRKMPVIQLHKNILRNCSRCKKLECVNNNTKMPVICHQIKAGNGVYHREDGCILVGQYIAPGCLKRPKQAFDALYDRIRKTAERGHELTIEIIENYPLERNELTNFELGNLILQQF